MLIWFHNEKNSAVITALEEKKNYEYIVKMGTNLYLFTTNNTHNGKISYPDYEI